MREVVPIGLGREARKTYNLSDVGILPSRPTRSSKEVDLSWSIDAYQFQLPLIAHPTDALVDPAFAIAMHQQGGLAVLNAEGIVGRHEDYQAAIAQVLEPLISEETQWSQRDAQAIAVLQKLHAAPINNDLLASRIREIRDSGATVAVRASPQRARELAPVVIAAGAEILFIQGTHISAEHKECTGEALNLKDFIGTLDVPVVAGGVSDYATALHLMRAGAAGVIVGNHGTTDPVLGIEVGLATAIADVAAARRDYLDETGGRYVHVIADSDTYSSGDVAKAVACGADAVMLGPALSASVEAPASGFFWLSVAAHPTLPRGTVAENFITATRKPLERIIHGPSTDSFGFENFAGGLRRSMAKAGYADLKSFQKVDLTIV